MNRIEVYKDLLKKWRWRLISKNGRIMADSGQGYTRRYECLKSLYKVYLQEAKIVIGKPSEFYYY